MEGVVFDVEGERLKEMSFLDWAAVQTENMQKVEQVWREINKGCGFGNAVTKLNVVQEIPHGLETQAVGNQSYGMCC